MAVIHQYMRERFAGCGKMSLGSDSHTRYGAVSYTHLGEGSASRGRAIQNRLKAMAKAHRA